MATGTISVVWKDQHILWAGVLQEQLEQALEKPQGLPPHAWCVSNGLVSDFMSLILQLI